MPPVPRTPVSSGDEATSAEARPLEVFHDGGRGRRCCGSFIDEDARRRTHRADPADRPRAEQFTEHMEADVVPSFAGKLDHRAGHVHQLDVSRTSAGHRGACRVAAVPPPRRRTGERARRRRGYRAGWAVTPPTSVREPRARRPPRAAPPSPGRRHRAARSRPRRRGRTPRPPPTPRSRRPSLGRDLTAASRDRPQRCPPVTFSPPGGGRWPGPSKRLRGESSAGHRLGGPARRWWRRTSKTPLLRPVARPDHPVGGRRRCRPGCGEIGKTEAPGPQLHDW